MLILDIVPTPMCLKKRVPTPTGLNDNVQLLVIIFCFCLNMIICGDGLSNLHKPLDHEVDNYEPN